MKKLILIFILLFVISSVQAETIYEYLDEIIENENEDNVVIVIGEEGTGQDVIATQSIISSFQKLTKIEELIDYSLDTEIFQETNLILLGNPCDNSKIPELSALTCSNQLYIEGGAYVKVLGTNLIVSGSTGKDTRDVANIIANYQDYETLLDTNELILDKSFNSQIERDESLCGNGVCDPGENLLCSSDCVGTISCEDYCIQEGYISGICRAASENGFCLENEEMFGFEYCEETKRCCCEEETSNEVDLENEMVFHTSKNVPESNEVEENELNKYLVFGGIGLVILVVMLAGIYYSKKYFKNKKKKEDESPIIDE